MFLSAKEAQKQFNKETFNKGLCEIQKKSESYDHKNKDHIDDG